MRALKHGGSCEKYQQPRRKICRKKCIASSGIQLEISGLINRKCIIVEVLREKLEVGPNIRNQSHPTGHKTKLFSGKTKLLQLGNAIPVPALCRLGEVISNPLLIHGQINMNTVFTTFLG